MKEIILCLCDNKHFIMSSKRKGCFNGYEITSFCVCNTRMIKLHFFYALSLSACFFTGKKKGLPNMDISDSQYKQNVTANYKEPWSIALGFTYRSQNAKHSFFSTMEYFHRIKPYKVVEAEESPNLDDYTGTETFQHDEWLTVARSAQPVLNVAVGYRWEVSSNFLLLGGFKTDFNHQKNINKEELQGTNQFKSLELDVYHFTSGARFNIKQHVIFTGFRFAFGSEKDLPFLINIAEPEEYSLTEEAALQGTRLNRMDARYVGMSLYFGAIFNFGVAPDQGLQ